jgi:hypothetical protein
VRTIAYTIEKHVAFDEETTHRKPYKKRSKFAVLEKMEEGDSIVVNSKREVNLARAFASRIGVKIKTKRIDVRKYRVWKAMNDNN